MYVGTVREAMWKTIFQNCQTQQKRHTRGATEN